MRTYLEGFYGAPGGVDFTFLEKQDYILVECAECGLVFQREVPDYALLIKLYDEWIDPQWEFEVYERTKSVRYYESLCKEMFILLRAIGVTPSMATVLDFGMGWGDWCRIMKSFGCHVCGTELSSVRIEHAARFGVEVVRFEDLKQCQFDIINVEQVLEHVTHPKDILSSLAAVLKKGGILKVSVPNGWDIRDRLAFGDWGAPKGSGDSLNAVAPLEHINCFNYHSLVRLANESGLEEIYPEGPYQEPPLEVIRQILRPFWRKLNGRKTMFKYRDTRLYFRKKSPTDEGI